MRLNYKKKINVLKVQGCYFLMYATRHTFSLNLPTHQLNRVVGWRLTVRDYGFILGREVYEDHREIVCICNCIVCMCNYIQWRHAGENSKMGVNLTVKYNEWWRKKHRQNKFKPPCQGTNILGPKPFNRQLL